MSDTPTTIGTAFTLGCGLITYTGTLVEDATLGSEAEVEEILDENGCTVSKVITNKKTTLSLTALIKGTGFVCPAKGDVITINAIKYFTESSEVKASKGAKVSQWSFKGVKEASMTYA